MPFSPGFFLGLSLPLPSFRHWFCLQQWSITYGVFRVVLKWATSPSGPYISWLHLYFHQIMNLPRSKHPLYCCEQKSIPRLHKSPPDKWQHCYLETCSPNAAVSCANKIFPCTAFDRTPRLWRLPLTHGAVVSGVVGSEQWEPAGRGRSAQTLGSDWYSLFSVYNGESLNICWISDRFKQGQSDGWPKVQSLASTAYCTGLRQSMTTCRVGKDTGGW